jgi:hypothetical protein
MHRKIRYLIGSLSLIGFLNTSASGLEEPFACGLDPQSLDLAVVGAASDTAQGKKIALKASEQDPNVLDGNGWVLEELPRNDASEATGSDGPRTSDHRMGIAH